jgi:hypothetical protein
MLELGHDGADVFRVDGEVERVGVDHVLLDLAGEGLGGGRGVKVAVERVATWGCCWDGG